MKLIDIHTHKTVQESGILSVTSVEPDEYTDLQSRFAERLFSVGIHPWSVKIDFDDTLNKLSDLTKNSNVLAIGEIGLDKLKAAEQETFALQKKIFEAQLEIAKERKLPIIIHNVKSTSEILSALTKHKITNPVIFHGFRLKKETAGQIVSKGHYLSFGKLHNEKAMQATPLDRLFLETDNSATEISEIYESAAKTLGITKTNLAKIIENNYTRLFCNEKEKPE